jgi:DNA-binding transcriptional LysR family regulator
VGRTESFSEAARDLGLAPSSVTRQLDGLEKVLGVWLLNRSTRRVRLTDAGQLYIEHARRIVNEVRDARLAITELEAEPRGRLRVSAPIVFGRMHVASGLAPFLARYREVSVEISLTDQIVSFADDAVDVAIRVAALPDSTLVARKLLDVRRLIRASPAYLEQHGHPFVAEDLTGHDCLTFRNNVYGALWRAGSRSWRLQGPNWEIVDIPVSGRLEANNAEAMIQGARDGLGFVLLPDWAVLEDIRAGRLVAVLPDHRVGPIEDTLAACAAYSSSRYLSPKVRCFIDFFVERLRSLEHIAGGHG